MIQQNITTISNNVEVMVIASPQLKLEGEKEIIAPS